MNIKKMKQAQMVHQIGLFHHNIAHGKRCLIYEQHRLLGFPNGF